MRMFVSAPRGREEEQGERVKIVAVDLQAMAPLPGVTQIQGDITKVRACFTDGAGLLTRHAAST